MFLEFFELSKIISTEKNTFKIVRFDCPNFRTSSARKVSKSLTSQNRKDGKVGIFHSQIGKFSVISISPLATLHPRRTDQKVSNGAEIREPPTPLDSPPPPGVVQGQVGRPRLDRLLEEAFFPGLFLQPVLNNKRD